MSEEQGETEEPQRGTSSGGTHAMPQEDRRIMQANVDRAPDADGHRAVGADFACSCSWNGDQNI